MAKHGHVHVGGKVGRSSVTPNKLFSVDSYDLKFMSFKFGNVFIIFEMPRSSFLMSIDKMNIALLFLPSASEVLDLACQQAKPEQKFFPISDLLKIKGKKCL